MPSKLKIIIETLMLNLIIILLRVQYNSRAKQELTAHIVTEVITIKKIVFSIRTQEFIVVKGPLSSEKIGMQKIINQ